MVGKVFASKKLSPAHRSVAFFFKVTKYMVQNSITGQLGYIQYVQYVNSSFSLLS